MIRNAHVNLGHPSNHALVRLRRTAKCHADMIAYARHMKCQSCARRMPPQRIPRVALPYRLTRFNAIVGLDLKWIKDAEGATYYMLNILDLATALQIGVIVPDKRPATIAAAVKQHWIQWASTPEKFVADKGTEYYTDFQQMLSDLGCRYRLIPVEAAWQHGMVERHGDVLNDLINVVVKTHGVKGLLEMKDALLHVCMAKNRRPGRTGYSPRTLVFGIDERLVASGLNHYLEVPDDASIAASKDNPQFNRSMELRRTAMKALVDLDHSDKWRDAIHFPSRKAECSMFLPGHQVFFWKKAQTGSNLKGRKGRLVERWYGPGVIVGHEWDQTVQRDSYWVSYGGKCFLIAGTHLRHAEFEECLSHDKFVDELKAAFEQVQSPTFQYTDVRRDQVDPDDVPTQSLLSRLAEAAPDSQIFTHLSRAPGYEVPIPTTPIAAPRPPNTRPEPASEPIADEDIFDSLPAQDTPYEEDDLHEIHWTGKSKTDPNKPRNQRIFSLRGHDSVLVIDDVAHECYFLKWKTFNKMQRKGKELDPKFFDGNERKAFDVADAKEWQSFIDTGAVVVIPPHLAQHIPQSRIFARPMRYVRTNKSKEELELEAKSRIVTPGDVDPDGDVPYEDGGFRTDAPTCPQLAFHLLCSQAVLKKRRLRTFDCKTAFLTGKDQDRDIYCKPPKEGLPGVAPGSLLKLVKGAYGLREAPRLWYLRAREVLKDAGFEEMQTGKACFVLIDRSGAVPVNMGMLVLHVDDACHIGEGAMYERALQHIRATLTLCKEEADDFVFLGRHVVQHDDCSIEIDQHAYVKSIEKVRVPQDRRRQSSESLQPAEIHSYRSLVGQLAWPARESMPQIAYLVSDLQQRVSGATVNDLVHANNVLQLALRHVNEDQKLRFFDLGTDVVVQMEQTHKKENWSYQKPKRRPKQTLLCRLTDQAAIGAVHDASFMQQVNDGSQQAYCIMLSSTQLFEGKTRTHLLDWNSGKIHRKVRATLAAEAASAAKAFDRGSFARVMLHEIENGWTHMWERLNPDDCNLHQSWSEMCKKIPFALATDCKSLYDVCTKNGSMPEERRVALDLLDVRESIEEMGDKIRWIPTDHMLVDCLTKAMPAEVMLEYLKHMEYSFKYDDVLKNTKRAQAKVRKTAREKKIADNKLMQGNNQATMLVDTQPSIPLVDCRSLMSKLRASGQSFRKAYVQTVNSVFGNELNPLPQVLYGKRLLNTFV